MEASESLLAASEASARSKRSRRDTFGSEQGPGSTPRIKRQRVSQACDQCRAGREKCNGLKPTCQSCSLNDRTCTYVTNPKKRGIQPGYIRTLELSLAWIFSQGLGAEELLKKELCNDNSEVPMLLSGKASGSEQLHGQWTSSITCKQIDQLLSGAEVDTPPPEPRPTSASKAGPALGPALGPSPGSAAVSALDPVLGPALGPSPSSMTGPAPSPALGPSSGTAAVPGLLAPYSTPPLYPQANNRELPEDFWKLLDMYYLFTHSWLPISEKNDVLKTAYSYSAQGVTVSSSDPGSGLHAELWAILAVSSYQTNPPLDPQNIDTMIFQARSLIPNEDGTFEIGHLKALLLLTLIFTGRRAWTAAWLFIGSAVRVMFSLNLHIVAELANSHQAFTFQRSKHIVLACFVLENILCLYLGKPAHLTVENISRIGYLDQDGLEEWSPWEGQRSGTGPTVAPPRLPSRSLSIFNDLVRTLTMLVQTQMNEGSISGLRKAEMTEYVIPLDSTRAGPSTPQQIHLIFARSWRQIEADTAVGTISDLVVQKLHDYDAFFDIATFPPSLIPLVERLTQGIKTQSSTPAERELVLLLTPLFARWSGVGAPADHLQPSSEPGAGPEAGPRIGLKMGPWAGSNAGPRVGPEAGSRSRVGLEAGPRVGPQVWDAFGSDFDHIRIPSSVTTTPQQAGSYQHGIQLPDNFQQQTTPMYDMNAYGTSSTDLQAIFEEIASLDGSRQPNDEPQFMRNLGVGPDLDLSAFFGADYQHSDPMLAYFQPDAFGSTAADPNNLFRET